MKSIRNKIAVLMLISYAVLVGCISPGTKDRVWPSPNPPIVKDVVFIPIKTEQGNGVFVSEKHTINLAANMSEQKRYTADLESQIESMKEYYKTK